MSAISGAGKAPVAKPTQKPQGTQKPQAAKKPPGLEGAGGAGGGDGQTVTLDKSTFEQLVAKSGGGGGAGAAAAPAGIPGGMSQLA